MAGTVKGIIVEIGGDTSGLQNALKKVNSATSSLSKELRGINSLLKLDPTNTELVSQKQQVLAENIEQTTQKLEELKKIQDEANASANKISPENYRALQREIISTENKLKDLQVQASKWTTAGKSIEEFGNKVKSVSDKLDTLGSTLTTTLTLPVLAIGTAAVTTGNDFEAQMSRVQAIAGATGDELEQLTQQAMDLGAETSFSASEVAEGMENLASAGFNTQEIMEAMPGLLDLAASSGADLATSSEIAASAIRGFGLDASSSAHVADVFAEAAARTNAQTEDMGNAMKYIAPVANTMGLKIEEVAAAIGIMSDAGIKGEQAGTTLRGALTRLTKPTDKMISVMEELGISFYDNEGKMKSLTEIIAMLQDATKDLTDEQEQNALTTLFGTESLSGMVALINRGSDDLKDMTKEFENCDGAASDMADTMLDNTQGALESLSGSFETAGIAIQKALAPEIKKLAKWIQGLVDDFSDLSEEEQLNIIKTVVLVAAIGPAIKILSKLSNGVGTAIKGVGTLSQAIGVMTNKTTSTVSSVNNLVNAFTLLKNPVVIMTAVIAAGTAAMIAYENAQQEELGNSRKIKKAIEDEIEARNSLIQKQNEQINVGMTEINRTQELYNELTEITDENGKIKDGYEERANYIITTLSQALDIEINKNGDIIDSYKELQGEIEKTILKKKAETILQQQEESYNTALKNRESAYERLTQLQNSYTEALQKYSTSSGKERFESQKALQQLQYQLQEQQSLIDGYNNDIATYEYNYSLMCQNTTESLTELVNNAAVSLQQQTDNTYSEVTTQIGFYTQLINDYKRLKDEQLQAGNEYRANEYEQQEISNKKQLEQLAEQLMKITNETNIKEPEVQTAWKNLANNANGAFFEVIEKMPDGLRNEILKLAGIINEDTSISNSSEELGKEANTFFRKGINANNGKTATEDYIDGANEGLNNKKTGFFRNLFNIGQTANENLRKGLGDGSPSVLAKQALIDYFLGADIGIEKQGNKTINELEKYGALMHNEFSKSLTDNNILRAGKLQGKLNSNLIESQKTIFTTPKIIFNVQELDEAKLQQCFDYVNRKFGSQY